MEKDHPMATKTKTAGDHVKDTAETVAKNGAEAFKNGFEKAVKGYDQVLGFGKENVELLLMDCRGRLDRNLCEILTLDLEIPPPQTSALKQASLPAVYAR